MTDGLELARRVLGDIDQSTPEGREAWVEAITQLPAELANKVANNFGDLSRLQRATIVDLMEVDGVDETIATTVKETLERVTENTILDQYS